MAQQLVRGGAPLDIPTTAEIGDAVDGRLAAFYARQRDIEDARERERARAVKWMRLPNILRGTVASNAISFTIGNGFNLGPDQGYAWSVRRLAVTGLASGATPDVVNLFLHSGTNQPLLWQFTGNAPCATFGKLTLTITPGDRLELVNSGNLAATGFIQLSGELIEVPMEMLWKLT